MKNIFIYIILFICVSIFPPKVHAIYKNIATSTSEWSFETSGSQESITQSGSGWICTAGGYTASTHYARIKYKLPENAGLILTKFYMKAVIVLPSDFYTKNTTSFRIMNTDNFGTTLNGTPVGASGANELRTAVYINSNQTLSVKSSHDQISLKEFYNAGKLPTGEHTLELFGDVANVAPWWFKIDGQTKASGTARLSPDTVPSGEREITRLVAGIDGAADQDANTFNLTLKSFEFSDSSPSGNPTPTPGGGKPGDANGDNLVDGRDYVVWVNHYGQSVTGAANGNFNGDTIVDGRDYTIWANNYGK